MLLPWDNGGKFEGHKEYGAAWLSRAKPLS